MAEYKTDDEVIVIGDFPDVPVRGMEGIIYVHPAGDIIVICPGNLNIWAGYVLSEYPLVDNTDLVRPRTPEDV